jgi:hypothetical protein
VTLLGLIGDRFNLDAPRVVYFLSPHHISIRCSIWIKLRAAGIRFWEHRLARYEGSINLSDIGISDLEQGIRDDSSRSHVGQEETEKDRFVTASASIQKLIHNRRKLILK